MPDTLNCKHKAQGAGISEFCKRHNQYLAGGTCDKCPEYEPKDTLDSILEELGQKCWEDGTDNENYKPERVVLAHQKIEKFIPKEMPIAGGIIPVSNVNNQEEAKGYINGWNACRDSMLKKLKEGE
jgi:hypothetical protein